jgi:L-lactate dehydrogenase complex protein LldG
MSSKDSILASIRRHTGTCHEMPELTLEAITYADKLATFSEVLAGAGGKAIELKPGEDVNEVIRREFPEAKRIASNLKEITCATFNPDGLTDPRELNGTDVWRVVSAWRRMPLSGYPVRYVIKVCTLSRTLW